MQQEHEDHPPTPTRDLDRYVAARRRLRSYSPYDPPPRRPDRPVAPRVRSLLRHPSHAERPEH